jgi:hypothetical protein
LSVEQRAAFLFSETPIPISRISERINMLRSSENVATLGFAAIRDWLVSVGMLERVTDNDGKAAVRPTAQGESIGIATEVRTGSRGTFVVVVYNLDAQNFIMDNLDAIIEFERIRKEKRGPNWRAEHDRILWELHRQGVPVSNIAEALGRDPDAVGERLKKLGITK